MKISLSVIKDLYTNLHSFDLTMKELIRKFLKDKVAIQSYVEDLKHDVEMIADDFDTTSYKKGIAELTALSLAL